MDFFKKKPTAKEQVRQNDRVIRKGQRDMARERLDMERQEKKLEQEIKQAAKRGDRQTAAVLAKQLVNLRKQKTRTYVASSKMGAIGNQQKMMASNMAMADSMKTAATTMTDMNKVMDPEKMAATMREFEKQNMKMEMSEEMINDTLDEIFDESGDEEEQDAIVNKVLDEIGIEISGKMRDAPSAHKGALEETGLSDADLEKQLAQLKAL